jgi:chemotaxis protein CheZ
MNDDTKLRRDLTEIVSELRATLREIGDDNLRQANLVTNTRDRLRYIASLTEQAASQTLNTAERVGDRLRAQKAEAEGLSGLTRSPQLRDFLFRLQAEHAASTSELREVIQVQAFQDLVGQVVNKLMNTVQHMEDSLAHLLVEDVPDEPLLAGPQILPQDKVSQDDIDDLFG